MELETIEKIITMVGEATGDAAMIAILWIVGGFLVVLINSGIAAYVITQIIKLVYKYIGAKEENKTLLDGVQVELKEKTLLISNHDKSLLNQEVEHRIELEKVKHLYKILKDKKDAK